MKKNILYRLYAAAFIGVCLVPAVMTPFVGSSSSKEKRELAAVPKLTREGKLNTEFFSQFETYFSEHFAFRQQLVDINSRLATSLLKTSPDTDVISGRDGWLFYGETADDFLNINTLSRRAINNIHHNLRLIDNYCRENGADFIFFSAPNKNSLYPEYMPPNYVETSAPGNYEMLTEALSGERFYCDMKAALSDADSSIPLYHKTDTHWNNLGAYAGHTVLMGMLGKAACPAGNSWFTKNDRLGDLAAMIYPAEAAKDVQVYNDYQFTYTYKGRFRGLDDVTINTQSASDGSLLMFRDSYGKAILPYMAECFAQAQFSRAVPYDLDNIQADAVILEIVERNLGDLQKYAPLMSAPIVQQGETPVIDAEIFTESAGKYTHIYGTIPKKYLTDSTRIIVTVSGISYEAFNCFEDKLMDREGEICDNGFSLYIPGEITDVPEITISE